MEEKTIDLFNDTYYDSGVINVDGSKLHCWKHEGHGQETFLEVVENSCNPGFVIMAQRLGVSKLMGYIKDFGFGTKTGIDLNGESTGILFKEKNMGNVELATTGFGQGISVTPIQQIAGVSAAINGGTLYKPYIVSAISDATTNMVLKTYTKSKVRNIISGDTSSLVRYALESVVANGTGHNAYIENYRVGGKTGTAQKVNNGTYMDGNYILSFIGFMPADDPELIVYVAIDNPKGVTQYGGTVAAPIAKNILKSAIEIFDIKEDYNGIPKEYTWLDEKYVKTPDVVGKSKDEVKKILSGFKIEYSGYGNKVISQLPIANSYVKDGGTIRIMLSE